ncbi:hypothetical protein AAFF_G00423260 [Aldrovandia affinis]|uniref:Uncharacterized protein n=1 Tax=Aldrovandia affinis TaxID=143900 RepID=A0AAD7WZD8_9TELE|nr:hypothetical protein AAFF_G00423260 [Aldrovandia affinis]
MAGDFKAPLVGPHLIASPSLSVKWVAFDASESRVKAFSRRGTRGWRWALRLTPTPLFFLTAFPSDQRCQRGMCHPSTCRPPAANERVALPPTRAASPLRPRLMPL